jgi:hypothetical protein
MRAKITLPGKGRGNRTSICGPKSGGKQRRSSGCILYCRRYGSYKDRTPTRPVLSASLKLVDAVRRSSSGSYNSGLVFVSHMRIEGAVHCRDEPLNAHSRLTSFAVLSSRNPMNRLCLRCASPVHSTYSNCPTSTGFSHNVERRTMPYAALKEAAVLRLGSCCSA